MTDGPSGAMRYNCLIKRPVVRVAHTPSGPTNCCEKHATKIVALFNHLGVRVHLEPLFDDRECDESKKAGN